MKKLIVCILSLVLFITVFSITAYATDSITFRDIKWLDSYKNVISVCDKIEGAKPAWIYDLTENARITSWDDTIEHMLDPVPYAVDNGGVVRRYENVPVAGYTADMDLSFIYPIENGKVNTDTNSAQFYKAEYEIKDLEDFRSAYQDLQSKLESLYGPSEDYTYTNILSDTPSKEGRMWKAHDGSLIWMYLDYNMVSEKYYGIYIVYAAPNTNQMIVDLDSFYRQSASNQEAENRTENSSNYGGL